MGFDPHWIKLMRECISLVQYRVLLNGQPRGLIIPNRGLRQGDPLSPYLIIMCTKALITNIKKAEREKQITGMKVTRACPRSFIYFLQIIVFSSARHKERSVKQYYGF